MRRLLVLALAAAVGAAPAAAAPRGPKPLLGVRGDAARFASETGQRTRVFHQIVGWGQGVSWGTRLPVLLASMGEVPMLAFGTGARWPSRVEAITPAQIAAGAGDDYLVALNRAIAAFGRTIYVRPLGEMNGYWNVYCAYTRDGRPKPGHSTASFRKAFARIDVILHGGAAANERLRSLGLPPAAAALADNPYPRLRVVWNPQGYGAPDIPQNAAAAYYPGDAYVDVVGNDLYFIHGKAEWEANERLYRAHPSKPYAFPEWGLWGVDDPSFVAAMARFVRTHRRVELLSYFEGKPGSLFDLAAKPRALAAYRRLITPLG